MTAAIKDTSMNKTVFYRPGPKSRKRLRKRSEKSSLFEFLLSVMNYETPNKDSQHIHSDFFSFYECRHLAILSQKLQKHETSRHMTSTPWPQCPVVTPQEIKPKLGKYLDPKKDSLQNKWNRLKKAQSKPEAIAQSIRSQDKQGSKAIA